MHVLAWERLDELDDELYVLLLRLINMTKLYRPALPILVPPHLYRYLCSSHPSSSEVILQPTPFGTRQPPLPVARTITLARVATAEGVDKRYERSWLRGMKAHFARSGNSKQTADIDVQRLVRRGDVIAIPVWLDKPVTDGESSSDSDDSEAGDVIWRRWPKKRLATEVAYFVVSALSYEPLVPIDEDFRSSISSKARAGELGCWIDIGEEGSTKMVIAGVERTRVRQRDGDRHWCRTRKPSNEISFDRSCSDRTPTVQSGRRDKDPTASHGVLRTYLLNIQYAAFNTTQRPKRGGKDHDDQVSGGRDRLECCRDRMLRHHR